MLILLSLSSVFGEDPFQKCNQSGLCLGHLIEVQESEFNSIYDCVYRCKEVSGCKFVSFHSKHKTCTLSRACRTVVLKESDYTHSSVNCDHKILIVGGIQSEDSDPSHKHFEVLSLKGDATCEISDGMMGYTIGSNVG